MADTLMMYRSGRLGSWDGASISGLRREFSTKGAIAFTNMLGEDELRVRLDGIK